MKQRLPRCVLALAPALLLLRPRQWYKNGLVLVPLVFSGNAATAGLWLPALAAALAFCLLAGATYAANDVLDRRRDLLHPKKRLRPVASGAVPVAGALALAAVCAAAGLAVLAGINATTFVVGAGYLLLQALYNPWLKHVVLWDSITVGAGFVLRALAGTTAIDVGEPTEWLIVCTFLFAFYLALAKRRHELLLAQQNPAALDHRPILGAYNVAFVEQTMQVATALLLTSYSLYTFFGTTNWMMFTLPFAYYGIFRYNYLVHRRDMGDEAELIFTDRATLLNAAAWLAVVILVLSGWPQEAFAWIGRL